MLEAYTEEQIIQFCIDRKILGSKVSRDFCNCICNLKLVSPRRDGFNLRCINYECSCYEVTICVKKRLKFERFGTPLRTILKILPYKSNRLIIVEILQYLEVSKPTLLK